MVRVPAPNAAGESPRVGAVAEKEVTVDVAEASQSEVVIGQPVTEEGASKDKENEDSSEASAAGEKQALTEEELALLLHFREEKAKNVKAQESMKGEYVVSSDGEEDDWDVALQSSSQESSPETFPSRFIAHFRGAVELSEAALLAAAESELEETSKWEIQGGAAV